MEIFFIPLPFSADAQLDAVSEGASCLPHSAAKVFKEKDIL